MFHVNDFPLSKGLRWTNVFLLMFGSVFAASWGLSLVPRGMDADLMEMTGK